MPSDKYRITEITSAFIPAHNEPMLVQVKNRFGESYVLRASSKIRPQGILEEFLANNKVKIGYPVDEIISFDRKNKTFLVSWQDSYGFPDDRYRMRWPNWNLCYTDLPYDEQMEEFVETQTPSIQKMIKKLYKNFNGEYEARDAENDDFQVFADNDDEEDEDNVNEGSEVESS